MIVGRLPDASANSAAGLMGSIMPAMWSFQLALRIRGLGSCLTTLHLGKEAEAAELLGIPEHMTQAGLLPVAYTKGTDFKPAQTSARFLKSPTSIHTRTQSLNTRVRAIGPGFSSGKDAE